MKKFKRKVGSGNHKNHARKHTDKEIIRALKNSNGFLTLAAESLGLTYQAVYQRTYRNTKLKKVVQALNERQLDFSESKLLQNIKKGKEASIFFHLKYKGKRRGYVDELKVGGIAGQPIEHTMTVFSEKKLRNLSAEELQVLVNIFEKVKGTNGHGSLEKEKEVSRIASAN